ncbi:hypothetical protein diail_11161 [Diaporthe ilicicola]|nr:hypothetical protein diail_11161 [Diaporthe ilicicola]
MKDIIRDSFFGQCCRIATNGRVFKYPEEIDPSVWHRYINDEKSANMGRHGQSQTPEHSLEKGSEQDSANDRDSRSPARSSSTAFEADEQTQRALRNDRSGRAIDPEKGKDLYIVDCPKKFFVTFEICFLTFSVYIGSAIFSAGIQDVMKAFGVSQVAATLGLTLFVAGYAVGPMVWAPLSEIPQVGRNPVYILTLAAFVALQVPTALATSFGMLLAFRFLTGFIGSPALATGGASIGDMYSPAKRTYGIAVWGVGAVCGPTLGPLVGGFAVQARGWSWAIWELMWLSGFCLAVLVFLLPETSPANILCRRARRLRGLTGNDALVSEPELAGHDMTARDVVSVALVRPFSLLFTEPVVFALDLYIALVYGLLYIWFESFPIVFEGIYGFGLGTLGLAYLGILIGVFVVLPPFVWYQHRYIEPKFNDNGELTPEWRLTPAFVGAFAIPVCLFWFGWTSRADIHWIVPIIGTAWFSVGAFLLFNAVLNYLSDAYPEYAASVLAGNDFLRGCVGAGFPLFAAAMYEKLGVNWASSTLGFISIAFIPIPFVLFKYGHWVRSKSKHARHDL